MILENNRSMKKKFIFYYPNLVIFFISLISLFFIINQIKKGEYNDDFLTVILFLGLSWFIFLIDYLLKLRITSFLYLLYFIFFLFTIFLGYLFKFFLLFPWYKYFAYFLGGIFTTFLGLFIIIRLDNIGYLKFSIVLTYSLFFSGFTISLWAIATNILSKTLNGSLMKDISNDIIMGLIGSITMAILFIFDNIIYHNRYLEKILRKIN